MAQERNADRRATNISYTLASVVLADNNALFRLVASNVANSISYVVTNSPATLTVVADTNKPVLLSALSQRPTQVSVSFSERIKTSTATNLGNFSSRAFRRAVAIFSATPDISQTNIPLAVASLLNGSNYTLTVNNRGPIRRSECHRSQFSASFTASIYTPVAIGGAVAGLQNPGRQRVEHFGRRRGCWRRSDQFQFSYVQRTNDFDVMVRLDSLSLADAWAEAGMMAREALLPGARGVSVMVTPTISGLLFSGARAEWHATTLTGSFPANYPNTRLRLKRVGNDFTGYAGFDGQNWTQLGT